MTFKKTSRGFTTTSEERGESSLSSRPSAVGAKARRAFTLIEILVVIGIIAILAAIVLIAINPARQFAQANNSQRTSNVNAILNAVGQYVADNQGRAPSGITDTVLTISTGGADICGDLVPTYLPALPIDPSLATTTPITDCSASYATGYDIVATSTRITVSAPFTEKPPATADISVTR